MIAHQFVRCACGHSEDEHQDKKPYACRSRDCLCAGFEGKHKIARRRLTETDAESYMPLTAQAARLAGHKIN